MSPQRRREVETIFESVIDTPVDLRERRLAEICAGDEELRCEVEMLLRMDASPLLVDEPAWQVAGDLLDEDAPFERGAQLGQRQP